MADVPDDLEPPVITRHIALAMSRHGSLTPRTVMQLAREIAKSGAAGLRLKN
jgi:LysR family transcriptional regulator, nitrogen assimilation regulatory protein